MIRKNNNYIRNNSLIHLQNISFVNPLISTDSYLYYNNFTQVEEDNFKWTGEGDVADPQGPVLVNSNTVWGFLNLFPTGNQCIEVITSGQHTVSLYYHTTSGEAGNPINMLIDNTIIGTTSSIAVYSWTLFSQTFTIPISGIVIEKLEVTLLTTTGIENIVVV